MSKYFTEAEIACSCCGKVHVAEGFMAELDALRDAWGKPLAANCICRCEANNKKVGGAPNSYHLITHEFGACAADISTVGWGGGDKWRFIFTAMKLNFSVGVGKTFIHVDRRTKYDRQAFPTPVLFLY